ncbi:MAG TPA: hypothetical protein VEV84_11410, partial [Pyrinomonadaceae bacterium]|nr:hypothetical protein [Pyrinomonadaceae bacterium]
LAEMTLPSNLCVIFYVNYFNAEDAEVLAERTEKILSSSPGFKLTQHRASQRFANVTPLKLH